MSGSVNVPKFLWSPVGWAHVSLQHEVMNRTPDTVVIEGNRLGFVGLANVLLFCLNDLQARVTISDHQLLEGSKCSLVIAIDDGQRTYRHGKITTVDEAGVEWRISEDGLLEVAAAIHGLGYSYRELHLDQVSPVDTASVYCVVADSKQA